MNNYKIALATIVTILLFSCNSYKEVIKGSYSLTQKTASDTEGSFIIGKVLSKEDGQVIKDASVSIVGSGIGQFTDIEGEFKIEVPPNKYRLEVKFTGYDDMITKGFRLERGKKIYLVIHLGTTKLYQTN